MQQQQEQFSDENMRDILQKILTKDQFSFNTSLKEWTSKPISEIKMWLRRTIPHIKYCLKIRQTQTKESTSDIPKCFVTEESNNNRGKQKEEGQKEGIKRD